ncbi:MAG: tetratricopeptide repeat protein [Dehalococcoidia bacterium]
MKRVLKTLILLTILGAVAAYAWKRWQSRAPGPLWREDEAWPITPDEQPETAANIAENEDEPTAAPPLPVVVATGPLVADADFREMLAEDEFLEAIEPIASEAEEVAAPPSWAPPPPTAEEPGRPAELAPVEEPAYLAPPVPAAPEETAAPETDLREAASVEEPRSVAAAVVEAKAPAVEPPPPGERWYWPWQHRRPEAPADEAPEAAESVTLEESAEPALASGPGLADVAEAEALEEAPAPAAEIEFPATPETPTISVSEPEAVENAPQALSPVAEAVVPPAPEEPAVAGLAEEAEELLDALPAEAVAPPSAAVEEAEETAAEAAPEPWTPEPAAREEGGFRWPWQRDDGVAPLTVTTDLERLADQLDGEPSVAEQAPPPPPPGEPSPESGGFRWPWQKRKDDEVVAAVEPPVVDQAEFEETGLSWGITDEDESVAAEWLETAEQAEPPAPVAAPAEPEPSPVFEPALPRPVAPVEPAPAQAAAFIPGAPLTSTLEAALEQVRPEPVAQYAGRSAESFLDEGNVYFNVGQYGLAIERYSRALELDPNLTAGYYNRANARTRAGEYDLALDDYNSALELEPNDADALNNRGMLHLYRAGYGSALRDFNAALQIDPTDTTVIVNRGLAQLHGGDPAAALVDFQEAAALDDTDAAAHYGAAQAASALGNREEALRRLRRALQIDPAYAREAAADAKLVPLQGDAEFMRVLREAGGRR